MQPNDDYELTLEEYLRKYAEKQIQKINERTEELINQLRKEGKEKQEEIKQILNE